MRRKHTSEPSDISPAEESRLAEDLEASGPEPTVGPALRAELDRRWEDHLRDPNAGEPWDAVLAEILRELDEEEADRASAA